MKIAPISNYSPRYLSSKKCQPAFNANLYVPNDTFLLMLARSKVEANGKREVFVDLAQDFYSTVQNLITKVKPLSPLNANLFLVECPYMTQFFKDLDSSVPLEPSQRYTGPQLSLARIFDNDSVLSYDFTYNYYDQNQADNLFRVACEFLSKKDGIKPY